MEKMLELENNYRAFGRRCFEKDPFDSLGRIASYSGDIAEIAINMSAGALDFND